MPNRLSADYWEETEERGILTLLQMAAELRDQATKGGRVYGQVKLSPKMRQAMEMMAEVPPEEMV